MNTQKSDGPHAFRGTDRSFCIVRLLGICSLWTILRPGSQQAKVFACAASRCDLSALQFFDGIPQQHGETVAVVFHQLLTVLGTGMEPRIAASYT